ncbi:hypothetical protein HDV00_004820 [Rhizophlyctis rosea]|nr:hypothetical protein HDV00_004820 [Rhizophlyctis rosea]
MAEKTLSGGHPGAGPVKFIAYGGSEERRIVTGSEDGTVVVWELARAKVIRTFHSKGVDTGDEGGNPWEGGIGFGRQGRAFAGAVSESGMIAYGIRVLTVLDARQKELWACDVSTVGGTAVRGHQLSAVVFSPDNEFVYAATFITKPEVERTLAHLAVEAEKARSRATESPSSEKIEETARSASAQSKGSKKDGDGGLSFEDQIKRLRHSILRCWNVHTGQLRFVISVDEQLTTMAVSQDGSLIITAGDRGSVAARRAATGELIYVKEVSASTILQVLPVPKTLERTGRKQSSPAPIFSAEASDLQVLVSTTDGLVRCCTLEITDGQHGHHSVTTCSFSTNGAYLLTVGGGPIVVDRDGSPQTAVQVWDVETGLVRYRLDVGSSGQSRSEVIYASWMPSNPGTIVTGCSNGLITLFSIPSVPPAGAPGVLEGTMIKQFWAEPDLSWSNGSAPAKDSDGGTESRDNWPFAAGGCKATGYALHHKLDIIAIAYHGKQRFKGILTPAKLPDIVQLAFWNLSGTPCSVVTSPDLNICFDPYRSVPGWTETTSFAGLNPFAIEWDSEMGVLHLSDDASVWKRCSVTVEEGDRMSIALGQAPKHRIHVLPDDKFTGKPGDWTGPAIPSAATCISTKRVVLTNRFLGTLSPAGSTTAFTLSRITSGAGTATEGLAQIIPSVPSSAPLSIHTTFAYSNGLVCDRTFKIESKTETVNYLVAHAGMFRSARVIMCTYVPWCGNLKRGARYEEGNRGDTNDGKQVDNGVVVSVGQDGLVLVQDYNLGTVNAVFHADEPLHGAALCPRDSSDHHRGGFKVALCGANGHVSIVKYHP